MAANQSGRLHGFRLVWFLAGTTKVWVITEGRVDSGIPLASLVHCVGFRSHIGFMGSVNELGIFERCTQSGGFILEISQKQHEKSRRVRFASVLNARGGEWPGLWHPCSGSGRSLTLSKVTGTTSGARAHRLPLLPQLRSYASGVRLSVAKGDRKSLL
jgi:hypothetical protein